MKYFFCGLCLTFIVCCKRPNPNTEKIITLFDSTQNDKIQDTIERHICHCDSGGVELTTSKPIDKIEEEEINKASLEKIPEDYKVIDLRISRTNTMKYFSFLYTTIDKNGESLMSKQDFIEVFKYGIAIPPQPAKKLLQLNSKVLNIGSINYAIYQFYSTYSRNSSQKKDVMRFIGYYFEIFNQKILKTKALDVWNKNLAGNKKPRKFNITLPNILPTPF